MWIQEVEVAISLFFSQEPNLYIVFYKSQISEPSKTAMSTKFEQRFLVHGEFVHQ